jgi:hypothetical protein
MKSHTIEIDDDVFRYLKKRAEPFEDTPNSVLRRELLRNGRLPIGTGSPLGIDDADTTDLFPIGTPVALQQILEVVLLVKNGTCRRNEATRIIAKKHNVAQQTVQDKYGRQLGMTADEFDRLLIPSKAEDLMALLIKKFPSYGDIIRESVNS